jgi:hypothetical protein
MVPGLVAFAAPARRSANRAVDKLDAAINQGLKSPDLNSSLGRLVAAAKVDRRRIFCHSIAEETQNWERSSYHRA